MKVTYNYKRVFQHPITLYRIGDVRLPYGIALLRVTVACVILGIMLLFRDVVNAVGSIMSGLTLVLYVGIPYLLSGFLLKKSFNGKRIHYFMYDFMRYFFGWYLPKKRIANDEEVLYSHTKAITFEKTIIQRKEGKAHATSNSDQNRTRQPHANEKRGNLGVLPNLSERHTRRELRKVRES
ncbi:conjugal transfer protein [Halobacillus sp. Marseille-Q1614]|uniref:conjugal transfer protein n=1 Tax=Halobacillus sp. Marseille-Q1614 TaxID=2709134 RepID=UPI0020C5812D|nr:conjugal transfer protein [Halobacillus sp. Marseille-Q1614]